MSDYYDVNLKRRRLQMLKQHPDFTATEALLEDMDTLSAAAAAFAPDAIAAADPEEFAAMASTTPAIHRFPGSMAARLQELAQLDRGLWVALASNPSTYPGLLEWLDREGWRAYATREAWCSRWYVGPWPAGPPLGRADSTR